MDLSLGARSDFTFPNSLTLTLTVGGASMDDDRRWSPLVWILPAAVGLFFWPTVLIFLYQQVIADYLSNRSIIGLVFSWIFGIPIAMMAISLVMLVPYILGAMVVGLAEKWRLTRDLVAVASLVSGLGLAILCVLALVNLFSGPSSNDDVARYFEQAKVLDAATDAGEERAKLLEDHGRIDPRELSVERARAMVEEELAATEKELLATQNARKALHGIVPPEQCLEMHLTMTESLQLTEQGLDYAKSAYVLALNSGRQDRDLMERANGKFIEVNRLHQRALSESNQCK